jgi:hypothetical protein
MTGRNPWVVLGVPEDSPYDEIQRAYRRRVKQTHPDSGGDACQFATVVRAFDAVRQPLRPRRDRTSTRPTPYDRWLRPAVPVESWPDDEWLAPVVPLLPVDGRATPAVSSEGSDFDAVLVREMSKARAAAY